jgi:hypothetical protein
MRMVLSDLSPKREPAHRSRTLAGKRQKRSLCPIHDCVVRPVLQADQAMGRRPGLNFDARTPRGSLVPVRSARERYPTVS